MKTFWDYVLEIEDFYRRNGVQIDPVPQVKLNRTETDRFNPFIPTANYNPNTNVISLYIGGRHTKDILRSFCHELIHHNQYLTDRRGFASAATTGALNENERLAELEGDAYRRGNLMFRKWTETYTKP
jgi:hypothetical protein